jgi:hypothetical protein
MKIWQYSRLPHQIDAAWKFGKGSTILKFVAVTLVFQNLLGLRHGFLLSRAGRRTSSHMFQLSLSLVLSPSGRLALAFCFYGIVQVTES